MNKRTILCIAAAVLLCACSGNAPVSDTQSMEALPLYRSTQTISQNEVTGEIEGYSYCPASDRFFYLSCSSEYTDDSSRSDYYLGSISPDGSEQKSIHLASGDISLTCPDFTSDGTGYYIYSDHSAEKGEYFLKKTDSEGNEISSVRLEDITDTGFENGYYPREICAAPDGIYVNCYDKIAVFDYDGKLIKTVSENNMNNWTMIKGASGAVYTWSYSGNGFVLSRVDISAAELVKAVDLPFEEIYDQNTYPVSGFGETELFMTDGVSLLSLDLEACTKEKVLDWVDSGVSVMEISKIFPAENGFVCGGSSFPSEKPCIYNVYLSDEKPAEKTELILAGDEYSLDAFIKNQAVCFNRRDDEYRVTLKTYPYGDIQALNMDMLSGKVPDILMLNINTPSDIYISKGIFADMYEFIDSDSEISREDLLPNLLKACETDGHLYTFTDRFKIFTVLGKTSIFGDRQGITFEELKSIAAQRPESTEIFPGSCKSDILDYALYMSGDRFINMKEGVCDFTSDHFIKLLEYANEYTDAQDMESYFDDGFWDRYSTMYADESSLLLISYLTDYGDIYALEHDNFGESVTAVGFPCDEGSGSTFEIDTGFAISSLNNREGAWKFVRTLLLPDYQDYTDSFSVRNDSQEKKAKKAMTPDPERVFDPITLMGHMMLSSGVSGIGEPSREDIDKVNAVISSAVSVHKYNPTVNDIISEEAARYFSGAISSKEAAEAIQGRVQIYLSESY